MYIFVKIRLHFQTILIITTDILRLHFPGAPSLLSPMVVPRDFVGHFEWRWIKIIADQKNLTLYLMMAWHRYAPGHLQTLWWPRVGPIWTGPTLEVLQIQILYCINNIYCKSHAGRAQPVKFPGVVSSTKLSRPELIWRGQVYRLEVKVMGE